MQHRADNHLYHRAQQNVIFIAFIATITAAKPWGRENCSIEKACTVTLTFYRAAGALKKTPASSRFGI